MGISVRLQPIARDLEFLIGQDLGPKAKSAALAAYAAQAIEEAKQQNKQAIGRVPPYEVYVDNREGAPLTDVRPDGTIRAEFQLVHEVLAWISLQLQMHSPVLTGQYSKSHELFADGIDTENPNAAPMAEEYVFLNVQPYARKIEGIPGVRPPQSPQAPDGVYQVVAELAQRRFGNMVSIKFSYRTAISGEIIGGKAGDRSKLRNPAIIVKLR